jgi:hypothetical protein
MKIQGVLVVLTIVNLMLLAVLLTHGRPAAASGGGPVLRGSALEIVDDQGRVRASIKVQSANTKMKKPNGKTYPENVMFRLIDPAGRPTVKLGGSVEGSGLGLAGETDSTYIQLIADGPDAFVRLTNKAGGEHVVKP